MAGPHGEFTRKFDREILKLSQSKARDADAAAHKEEAKKAAIEAELKKIQGLLDYRKNWLVERFPDIACQPPPEGKRGQAFVFPMKDGKNARLEFIYRLNDWGLAALLESRITLGDAAPSYDYISFPAEKVDHERAKSFIENKIMEFAQHYAS